MTTPATPTTPLAMIAVMGSLADAQKMLDDGTEWLPMWAVTALLGRDRWAVGRLVASQQLRFRRLGERGNREFAAADVARLLAEYRRPPDSATGE